MSTPQRLPIVNQDDGTWGDIIRQFLMKEHFNDDTDNSANGGHQNVTIRPGTTSAAPLTFNATGAALLSTPQDGAVEYVSSAFYITTGSTRKRVAIYDDSSGAAGDTYYRDGSGNLVQLPIGSSGQVLKVSGSAPAWSTLTNAFTTATKTSDYTLTTSDTVVLANAVSNNITLTLPAASSASGYRFYLKRLDASNHTISVATSGSDTIDGLTSMLISDQYDIVEVASDGSAWYVLSYTTELPSAPIAFRSVATTTSATGSSTTCNKPAGTVAGDVMVALYVVYNDSSATFTPPSGWVAIGSQASYTTSNKIISQAFYKVAGGGEPSSYTFSTSTGSSYTELAITTYTGVDTGNPVDASSANGGNGTTRTGTGVTTTTSEDKLLFLTAGFSGAISVGPSDMTQRTVWDSVNYIYDKDTAAAGATGNITATQTSDSWTAHMVALRPATTTSNAMYFATNTQTTNYTVTSTDTVVFADATSGNVTITLPAASGLAGYRFYIKRLDGSANSVTISRSGSDTIDGMTSFTLDLQYTAFGVVSNGSAWYIL